MFKVTIEDGYEKMYMQGTQEVNGGYRHDWRNKGGIAMVLWREYIYK